MTSKDGGISVDELVEKINLPRDRATEALEFLVRSGLCLEKNGKYFIGSLHVHIGNESPFVVKHHSNWRIKSIQKMDSNDREDLFFTSPMSMSAADYEIIKEKINVFLKDMIQVVKDSPSDELVCLNIDFFKPS